MIVRVRRKCSTPGDRKQLVESLPVVMTKLEMMLPLSWNTAVVHIFLCQTMDTIVECGNITRMRCCLLVVYAIKCIAFYLTSAKSPQN